MRSILKKFTHLVLNVHSSGVEKTLTEAEEESEIDSINEYAKQFVQFMPNVRYLRCNDSVYEEINSVFQKEVITLLSPRLHYVRCFSNNIESLQHFSKNILSLKLISQDTCALKSLRIRSDKLRGLVLNSINDDFNWKMFESKKKPGHIDFCNVERMELDTDSYFSLKGGMGKHVYSGPSKPFPFTINAPKLSILDIKLSPVVFSMLANTKLPKRLRRLEISGICRVNFILLDVNTKELLRVFSLYKDIGDNNLEHDSIINSLIGNPNVANKIECTIYRPLSFNEIELLDGRLFINTLDMYKPITFSNLLALISHMPMLSHVKVAKSSFAKDSEGKVSMQELRKEIEPYADLLSQKLCNMNLAAEEGQNCDGSVWKYIEDFMRKNMKQLGELNVC